MCSKITVTNLSNFGAKLDENKIDKSCVYFEAKKF